MLVTVPPVLRAILYTKGGRDVLARVGTFGWRADFRAGSVFMGFWQARRLRSGHRQGPMAQVVPRWLERVGELGRCPQSGPGAVSWSSGRIDVFVVGTDSA